MNIQNDPDSLATMKFGIGQPVPRTEDPTLVSGRGCYTDDIKLPGEAYAVMVRSRVAHGVIKRIDTAAARKMPGVLGVYTGADLADYGTLKCIIAFNNRDGSPMIKPPRPALPTDKVRFVGDPIAFVVARDAAAGTRTPPRRSRSRSTSCRPWCARRTPRRPARRSCTPRRRATSRSTTTTAIPTRWRPPSPRPRT